MKHSDSISGAQKTIILVAAAMIWLCLSETARCQNDTVLLLQQTPVQGGTITPGPGIHQFGLNASVTLTAVPNPGYQFVYWLGDVIDPTSSRTTIYLDLPKIVMAVFEQAEYQFPTAEEAAIAPTPDSSMSVGAGDYSRQEYSGSNVTRSFGRRHSSGPESQEDKFPVPDGTDDFPVPDGTDNLPVPAPEPATMALLGLGGAMLLAKREKSV